jgi:hypothetical protein
LDAFPAGTPVQRVTLEEAATIVQTLAKPAILGQEGAVDA